MQKVIMNTRSRQQNRVCADLVTSKMPLHLSRTAFLGLPTVSYTFPSAGPWVPDIPVDVYPLPPSSWLLALSLSTVPPCSRSK